MYNLNFLKFEFRNIRSLLYAYEKMIAIGVDKRLIVQDKNDLLVKVRGSKLSEKYITDLMKQAGGELAVGKVGTDSQIPVIYEKKEVVFYFDSQEECVEAKSAVDRMTMCQDIDASRVANNAELVLNLSHLKFNQSTSDCRGEDESGGHGRIWDRVLASVKKCGGLDRINHDRKCLTRDSINNQIASEFERLQYTQGTSSTQFAKELPLSQCKWFKFDRTEALEAAAERIVALGLPSNKALCREIRNILIVNKNAAGSHFSTVEQIAESFGGVSYSSSDIYRKVLELESEDLVMTFKDAQYMDEYLMELKKEDILVDSDYSLDTEDMKIVLFKRSRKKLRNLLQESKASGVAMRTKIGIYRPSRQ